MKIGALWTYLAALALAVWAADAPPAQPAAPTANDTAHILVDVTRVNMLFTVTDKNGRFITGLDKDDFEIIENKKRQAVQEFTAESDSPLRLAILVDTSSSIRDRFQFEQQAAIEFITRVVHAPADKAMVVSFDSSAELVSDMIGDAERLSTAVRNLRPGGGIAFYDAIYFACRDKLQQDQPKDKFRRAMVVLTDGEDNQSRYTRDQALEMAQKADVAIYVVSTNFTHAETDGDKVVKYLAQETGGRAFFPFQVEDLEQSFENIANELRHQYSIFYRPEPLKTDGLYHTVDLRVKGHSGLVVRARKGYYAPKM
ncbi:MAG TPA: VWA domain-containing protein [Bryobacteraceae bacterium]|nr:VWA domain-containing protein [Bryobacteraceae bacterium]